MNTTTALAVGDTLPSLTKPAITRTTLALFCGASNDHNPIHVDIDFARRAGMDDVFAHGMLSMAYLGQMLTNWAPQTALRSFGVRFSSITHLGDEITCTATVTERFTADGEARVRIAIIAANQAGDVKLAGNAVIAIS
jgi:acyl dehydratase